MTGPRLRDATNDPPKPPSARAKRLRWPPPAWLSAPGKVAFRRLILDLERQRPGELEATDVPAIALMAEAYAIAQAAAKAMRGEGNIPEVLEVDAVHGQQNRKTPAWQVHNQASARYVALAREFGLTLAARARLELSASGVPELPDEQDDLDRALRR